MKNSNKLQRTMLRDLDSSGPRSLSPAELRLVAGGAPEGTHDYTTMTSHWDYVRMMTPE